MRGFSLGLGLVVVAVSLAVLNPDANAGCRHRRAYRRCGGCAAPAAGCCQPQGCNGAGCMGTPTPSGEAPAPPTAPAPVPAA
jgi:hypothetical protein